MSLTGDFQREMKRQLARGRCLHFESGERCNEIIAAHSIQKSGQLTNIAENGHVYRMSAELSVLKKTGGVPEPRKVGLNKVSTFAGFCKHHDNALFEPIDNWPLVPTSEQVALYAYRCLCREYFVKENAVRLFANLQDHPDLDSQLEALVVSSLAGHSIGLEGLKYHKAMHERALQSGRFHEFEFTVFTSRAPCALQMSGLLYPDFDFTGQRLQDISNTTTEPDLITFFTAPTRDGWAFCFAWHISSSRSCKALLQSLASVVHSGGKLQDALLRFSLSCCENHAFRISWWDGLPAEAKAALVERISIMASPYLPVPSTYLKVGCEDIADWSFENVFTTLSPST